MNAMQRAICAAQAAFMLCTGHAAAAAPKAPHASGPPSLVMLLTDDLNWELLDGMLEAGSLPHIARLMERGVTLRRFYVTYSFCCPSRATFLRGQYPHNHTLYTNDPETGGHRGFVERGLERWTIGSALAGRYAAHLAGKYFNRAVEGPTPSGWDGTFIMGDDYYGYAVSHDGHRSQRGHTAADYHTDVLARHLVSTIGAHDFAAEPLLLYAGTYGPHAGHRMEAPRHAGMFSARHYPRVPYAYGHSMDRLPQWMQRPPYEAWELAAADRHHAERMRAMLPIDDLVGAVVAALANAGALENTYIVFTSDNGFHLLARGDFIGKTTAYEEDIRVPLVIAGPKLPRGATSAAVILNNDVAPTFAALAGAPVPALVDGSDFMPLLSKEGAAEGRCFAVIRREGEERQSEAAFMFDALRCVEAGHADYAFIRHGNGDTELYDLAADPHQLANRIPETDPAVIRALSERLDAILGCRGAQCARIERLPAVPLAPGRFAARD